MSWNYSGRPASSDKDTVRFLIGDVCEDEPLMQDEEIEYSLTQFTKTQLAAALCLRSLAARYSRTVPVKVGDVSIGGAKDIAEAYMKRAKELDPHGLTASVNIALPQFGGLSISEKQTLAEDTDAVQPSFVKGMNDIPGGPGSITSADDDAVR